MECSNCGCKLTEDMDVCPECGSDVIDDAVEDVRVFPRETGLSVMKSPAYAIMAVAWLICVATCAVCFVNLFRTTNGAIDGISEFLGEDISKNIKSYFNIVLGVLSGIIGLPLLLKSIGIMISAVKARTGVCSGIGCIKAGFVFSIIFGIIEVLLLIDAGVAVSVSSPEEISLVSFWITCALIVAVLIFIIVFYAKVLSTLEVVRTAVEQNKCYRKTSLFVVFMSFFMAIPMLLMAISQNFGQSGSVAWLNTVFMVSYSISYILFGVMLLLFRRIEISDGIGDEYKTHSYASSHIGVANPGGERVSSRCMYCGRILTGAEVCVCRRNAMSGAATHMGKDPGDTRSGVRRCPDCGRILYGAESCSCRMSAGGTTRKSEGFVSKNPGGTSGGLRSTMKKTSRTSADVPGRTTTKSISDADKKRFFDSGGDLD